jgi:hypothetical protein
VTPTRYYAVKLAKLPPQERRERLRLIVGETLTALPRRHGRGFCPNGKGATCDHGAAWTSRELDAVTYAMWMVGRVDSSGGIIGGPNDGAPA